MKDYDNSMAIQMRNVCKHYPHFDLQNISLELPKGSIMGFIGPNGAGKSTTIRILMGLVQQDSGIVNVLGNQMPTHQIAAKWDIGFASEDMRLYKNETIQWHMDYIKSIYPTWDTNYAKQLVKRFDLTRHQKVKGLSHGQRVKAGLLLMLARKPKLLLLDEPTTGLDPVARHEVINELMDVLLDEERSILFSSHNTQDVEQLSDEITFIDKGRIISSENKESYLEKWRRIRLEISSDKQLPSLTGMVEQRRSGTQAIITAKSFSENMAETYRNCGAHIHSIENMTLEEIFVSEVQSSRAFNSSLDAATTGDNMNKGAAA
ncbi:ABC transporter ATP-binding protein [Aliikangiella marina]|uniref:ABC transporter ATP-binding protein n=1 Tax=Aliikangiella marina TaxID=1712262 RepID=A0A545TH60_9GAMM|nr:ABC transporter ATP-binding protein [Aliikangiella marina]TQV76562.1 ABC transporter ATP-binding protein [Aliikangiella marina]